MNTIETPEYTTALAERVHDVIGEFYPNLSNEQTAHIITEAFYCISHDVRNGIVAELEYVGQIRSPETGRVIYHAAPEILSTPKRQEAIQ